MRDDGRRSLTGGHARALLLCKDHARRRSLARSVRDRGWSVRETERRAREAQGRFIRREPRDPVVIHPDLADALGAAEDALSAALGREVKVRPRGRGYRIELDVEDPREAIELAEAILRRHAA